MVVISRNTVKLVTKDVKFSEGVKLIKLFLL